MLSFLLTQLIKGEENKEIEELEREKQRLLEKLAWYEIKFGLPPEHTDFREFYQELQLLKKQAFLEHRKKFDAFAGDPIHGVIRWSLLGTEKDQGTLKLGPEAISYHGRKKESEIRYAEITKVTWADKTVTFKTRNRKYWVFDNQNLAYYGLNAHALQQLCGIKTP